MQTGVITPDNLSHVLRQLSQRRRQGILEIKLVDKVLQIVFMSGRVIEAIDSEKTPVSEVVELLKRGGYISTDYEADVTATGDPYKQLFLDLQEHEDFLVDEKLFSRAVRCRVLEKLYRLNIASGAYYSFKVQMVDSDRDLLPSVSVGQLLLDLVALDDDGKRFEELFPEGSWVEALPETSGMLSEEEEAIYQLCTQAITLNDLRDKALLSTFHFQDAMLSLKDRELVQVLSDGAVSKQTSREERDDTNGSSSSVEDMMAALDQTIDSSFADAEEELLADLQRGEPAPLVEDGDGSDSSVPRLVEEEDLDEDEWAEPSFKVRLNYMNMKMLHSSAVPHIIVILFLMCSALIPLLRWGEILAVFGGP